MMRGKADREGQLAISKSDQVDVEQSGRPRREDEDDDESEANTAFQGLSLPQSLSSAFLPRPPELSRPDPIDDRPPAI